MELHNTRSLFVFTFFPDTVYSVALNKPSQFRIITFTVKMKREQGQLVDGSTTEELSKRARGVCNARGAEDDDDDNIDNRKIGVIPINARIPSEYKSSFALIIDKTAQQVLLLKEVRGKAFRYNLLGGKVDPTKDAHSLETMAREVFEESGERIRETTISKYRHGDDDYVYRDVYFDKGKAMGYLVGLVEDDEEYFNGLEHKDHLKWVDISLVRSQRWRDENMHFCASVLAAKLFHEK